MKSENERYGIGVHVDHKVVWPTGFILQKWNLNPNSKRSIVMKSFETEWGLVHYGGHWRV
jgi:hypothetical protein